MNDPHDIIESLLPNNLNGKNLFHYTSQDGLIGIVNKKQIWCSHIFYLNDIEENLNGWKIFFDVLKKYKATENKASSFRQEIQNYARVHSEIDFDNLENRDMKKLRIDQYNLFVFSLSREEDDLSQWRSYTPESRGFCIHFKFDETFIKEQKTFLNGDPNDNSSASNCQILLRECIYKPLTKEVAMTRLLDYYFQQFANQTQSWAQELYLRIHFLSLFFKNEKFEHEKECRLVVRVHDQCKELIKIKPGKTFLVPYIELDTIPNSIKGITIGPSPFPYHSEAALKTLIRNSGLDINMSINRSNVPYRP